MNDTLPKKNEIAFGEQTAPSDRRKIRLPVTFDQAMKRMLKYSVTGFLIGIAVSSLYLFASVLFEQVPAWTAYLFYPGILTGLFLWETWLGHMDNLSISVCLSVGVLTMGLVFGVLACALRFLLHFKRRTKEQRNLSDD